MITVKYVIPKEITEFITKLRQMIETRDETISKLESKIENMEMSKEKNVR